MSNLYKGSMFANGTKEARVIDSNKAVSAKIMEIKKSIKANGYGDAVSGSDGFVVGIDAKNVEALISEEEVTEKLEDAKQMLSKDVEYMLNNADMQAKGIIDKGRHEKKCCRG